MKNLLINALITLTASLTSGAMIVLAFALGIKAGFREAFGDNDKKSK